MKKAYTYAGIAILCWSTVAIITKLMLGSLNNFQLLWARLILKEDIASTAVIGLLVIVLGIFIQLKDKKRTNKYFFKKLLTYTYSVCYYG